MMKFTRLIWLAGLFFIFSCQNQPGEQPDTSGKSTAEVNDPHSYSRPEQAKVTHLNLDIVIDFDNRTVSGAATWDIEKAPTAEEIILDVRDLDIKRVLTNNKQEIEFTLGSEDDHLGKALRIPIQEDTKSIRIEYSSRPNAAALLWLTPEQTADETDPFMFSQGQAILTRTWLPCQDSPGIRFTYDAKVRVPSGLIALMSAENPQEKNPDGVYTFTMDQPIPAYLMAIAAGNLTFQSVGSQTGVYAEPSIIEAAAWEFGEMQAMLDTAEAMYGPYLWDRYDVLVLPPSFPFGGMENPRLTFVTPTILAGDRSLTSLIAHELAHSWSGNLVTNKNWNAFWLNEGFTVYFERRIMEALYGKDYVTMLATLGYQDLERTIEELGPESEDTHLHLDLADRDPDEGMTDVAYEKGSLFLTMLENKAGRKKFDAFLKQYFTEHAFKTIDSESFVAYLNKELIEPNQLDVDVQAWIYEPGIPGDANLPESDRFDKVEKTLDKALRAEGESTDTAGWTTHEWLHFIRHIPDDTSPETMKQLDDRFGFARSTNSEIQAAWFEIAIYTGYEDKIRDRIRTFLKEVGRRKFLVPLYKAYKKTDKLDLAREIYRDSRENYHSVSTHTLDHLLEV